MSIQFDTSAFRADLSKLRAAIHKETYNAMLECVVEAERHAKSTPLFNDVTGTLRNSVHGVVFTGEWGELTADTKYALFVEAGTKPHAIKGNPLLKFYWEKAGEWVEFLQVNHPGTAPRPFMERAGEHGGHVLYDALDAYVSDAIRRY